MKNFGEKEQKLVNALNDLKSISKSVEYYKGNFEKLDLQKNQLISEKTELQERYNLLLKEHENLKNQLEKINYEVKDQFSDRNKFNKKVDELNQETENLIYEIDKWQT